MNVKDDPALTPRLRVTSMSMNRNPVLSCLLWACLLTTLPLTSQGAVTLVEDNFIYRGGADAVQSNTTSLTGKGPPPTQSNSRTIYLKFDMSAASIAEGIYADLALTTTTGTAGADFTLALYALNAGVSGYDWSETSITWNNSPGLGTDAYDLSAAKTTFLGNLSPITTGDPSGTVISTYFGDWESYLQADDSLTLIAVVTSQSAAGPSIGFASSENTTTSSHPSLTLSNVPEPSRAILSLLGLVAVIVRRRRPNQISRGPI